MGESAAPAWWWSEGSCAFDRATHCATCRVCVDIFQASPRIPDLSQRIAASFDDRHLERKKAMTANTGTTGTTGQTDIREFGHELWNYLTGKQAVIEYTFEDMTVEVPKTTGPDAPRATWKMNGTLRVRTSDQDSAGAIGGGTRNGAS
jgi:hypothetical protein